MKVLFLDIDGVLNNDKTFEEVHDYYVKTGYHKVEIGLDMVERLFKIIEATGAKIVLSSSWRLGWNLIEDGNCVPYSDCSSDVKLNSILKKYGLSIYSRTIVSENRRRGDEIKDWLDRHPQVTNYVILEDEVYDMMEYYEKGKVVKTNFLLPTEMVKSTKDTTGLQDIHVEQAIKILNGENDEN